MNTEKKSKSELSEVLEQEHVLVLHNDHENTFDFVIEVLCVVCEHTEEQAEQCAWITHYKGKCDVMSGSFEAMKSKSRLMSDVGLTVEVV